MSPSASKTSGPLTRSKREQFDRDGFLVVPRFVDRTAVDELREAYDEILTGAVKADGDRMLGGITRQVVYPSKAHPVFDDNAVLRRAFDFAGPLLEEMGDVSRVFDMLIYKQPGHREPTPWHQDFSYSMLPFAPAGLDIPLVNIQFWVAIDDADLENGCMHFLPGYHKQPSMEHHVASGDPTDEGRLLALVDPDRQVDLSRVVPAELPAGGCTMHSYGTPHYTPPNTSSERPRRAYIFTLGVTGASLAAPDVRRRKSL